MKINIELDSTLKDIELVIKTPDLNNDVILIKELVEKALLNSQKIIFYKNISSHLNQYYFLKLLIIRYMPILQMNSSKWSLNCMN